MWWFCVCVLAVLCGVCSLRRSTRESLENAPACGCAKPLVHNRRWYVVSLYKWLKYAMIVCIHHTEHAHNCIQRAQNAGTQNSESHYTRAKSRPTIMFKTLFVLVWIARAVQWRYVWWLIERLLKTLRLVRLLMCVASECAHTDRIHGKTKHTTARVALRVDAT